MAMNRTIHWQIWLSRSGVALVAVMGTAAFAAAVDVSALPPAATRRVDFVKDIQPIFAEHCYGCHGSKRAEAAFRLDSKDVAL